MEKKLLCVWILLLLLGVSDTYGQTRTISGLVISGEDRLPLPGVNVTIKGTTQGVTSDLDGQYSLQVFNNDVLVFSFVGFLSQEIRVGTKASQDVILLP